VIAVSGRPEPSPGPAAPDVAHDDISVDYFRLMAAPLIAGPWFGAGEREDAEPVVIVNEALARMSCTRSGLSRTGRVGRWFRGVIVTSRFVSSGEPASMPASATGRESAGPCRR
jgi:hypothetical protein